MKFLIQYALDRANSNVPLKIVLDYGMPATIHTINMNTNFIGFLNTWNSLKRLTMYRFIKWCLNKQVTGGYSAIFTHDKVISIHFRCKMTHTVFIQFCSQLCWLFWIALSVWCRSAVRVHYEDIVVIEHHLTEIPIWIDEATNHQISWMELIWKQGCVEHTFHRQCMIINFGCWMCVLPKLTSSLGYMNIHTRTTIWNYSISKQAMLVEI